MRDNKDDFIAFLPSTEDGMMNDKGFEKYCRLVAETGEWGGEPEVSRVPLSLQGIGHNS
jgi:OTU domain-containing protein 6